MTICCGALRPRGCRPPSRHCGTARTCPKARVRKPSPKISRADRGFAGADLIDQPLFFGNSGLFSVFQLPLSGLLVSRFGLDLGGTLFDQLDDMVDHAVIILPVILLAGQIDHAMPRTAAGE